MTEMQKFALSYLKERGSEGAYGDAVGAAWADHKGYKIPFSSRRRFGVNSAGYRALRSLCDLGHADCIETKTAGGYTILTFYAK